MENQNRLNTLRQETTLEGHRLLQFWRNTVLLPDGGFHGVVGDNGEPRPEAPRSLILAARILWTYSRAVNSGFEDTSENRGIADRTYDYLIRSFWDQDALGFFWMIDPSGRPLDSFKHVYGQAFAIYACAEYARMSGRDDALKMAQLTYTLLERYAADPVHGGYFESFTQAWTLNEAWDEGPVNHGGPKSMNSHLHILEAFTALYQVWPNASLKSRLEAVLDVMRDRVVHPATSQFHLFFEADWTPIGEVVSYGHDIEGSWLMLEAAEALGDGTRQAACRTLAVNMVDRVLQEGLDAEHGLMNEGREGTIIDGSREWWQQAEALVGFVNAFQVTNDVLYLQAAEGVWAFIQQYVVDQVHGEWRIKIDPSGLYRQDSPKVSPWKCPYHNTRACMELSHRLQ